MEQSKNVVLVHGAWADGSSWSKVIPCYFKSRLDGLEPQGGGRHYHRGRSVDSNVISLFPKSDGRKFTSW
jgi:hypothetical protein